ncbi:PAN1 (YIR006C) [Zygosaccharomyces parabailii]|nr:PAN1 (YIR006C) [Zygosaccharomyces parabailii]
MYNPYQNTGYFQQQQQQQQQQQNQQPPLGQQKAQVTGYGGIQQNIQPPPSMNFSHLQSQQSTGYGGANTAVNSGMNNLALPQNNFGSQQNTGMLGLSGVSPSVGPTPSGFGASSMSPQPQQQQMGPMAPQHTGYFTSPTLPLQQAQMQNQLTGLQQLQPQRTGLQSQLYPNPTGGLQPLLPQTTGFYRTPGGVPQAPLEPLKPTATGLVNSFANGGINHDVNIPPRRLSFITSRDQAKFETLFRSMVPKGSNTISGESCKKIFLKSGLGASELAKIWKLCDTTKAGELLFPEFALAMHLVNDVLHGDSIPYELDTKTKNEVSSFVDAINLNIARGDNAPGLRTPFDELMMSGLKPQPTGFMPQTSFGGPLQGQITGGGLLNPQRTGFIPQTSFGMPTQPTGGFGNLQPQTTGFMPATSFGAPLQSQLTGGAMQRQQPGGLQNTMMPSLQPQVTGGFPSLQPQKIQQQATGSILPQVTGGLRPQVTGGFQQQAATGFQPQYSGGYQPQATGGIQPQLTGGLKLQTTGGFQQQGAGGFQAPSTGFQPQRTGGILPQSTGGLQQQPTGGFQPQRTGGFQSQSAGISQHQPAGSFQPQPTGGFQPQPTGSFQPQPTGGFQPQPTSGFQPQPTGGFQPQPTGGFQPQPTGGFQSQPTGSLQPQGTGSFGSSQGGGPQPQGTGAFSSSMPAQSSGVSGLPPQQQPQSTGNLIPQQTNGGSTAVPIGPNQTGLTSQSTGFLPPSGFNPTQPLSAQKTGFGNNEIYSQSNFGGHFEAQNVDQILPEEKSLFYKIFETYDTQKRGLLDAPSAVEIFRKSGLNRSDLEHIWALCDTNNNGQLNKQEFALGMHLVYRKLNGFQLPSRLPLNLIPSSTKILDNVKNQLKSSVVTEDRRAITKTDALSYKNNDDEDVLPSFRNRRKVFSTTTSSATETTLSVQKAAPTDIQEPKASISDLKRAINGKKQRLEMERARLQSSNSEDDLRVIASLKDQISALPTVSVVTDSVPADVRERFNVLVVRLPNLFAQITEIDAQIRNAKLQLFKMKNPYSISGSGPNGEITAEDRKKAKSKALLKSRMNALTGKSTGPIGSFEEEEARYNEEIAKINASCDSNKEIIRDVGSSISELAASLECALSGRRINSNPSDFEKYEFGVGLEPEVRDFVNELKVKSNSFSGQQSSLPSEQPQQSGNSTNFQHNQQRSQYAANDNTQSTSRAYPQSEANSGRHAPTRHETPSQPSRQSHNAANTTSAAPASNQVDDVDDAEDEEEKQLREELERLKLKKKNDKERRLANLRKQIEEARAEGNEDAERSALQSVANQSSTSSVDISQVPSPYIAPPTVNSVRSSSSTQPAYNAPQSLSTTAVAPSSASVIPTPPPATAAGRSPFFKQTTSTSSSFDLKAAETQRRLQRGLDDEESDGWSDDGDTTSGPQSQQRSRASTGTATAPVVPAPVAPAPVAHAPVAPAPVAPAPVAPAPVAPAPVAPAPVAPAPVASAPVAPAPVAPAPVAPAAVAPTPVAPPLPQVNQDGPPVPIAPPLPQVQSENKSFFPPPPPLTSDTPSGQIEHTAEEDADDVLSIPDSVGSEEEEYGVAQTVPGTIPPPPPLP